VNPRQVDIYRALCSSSQPDDTRDAGVAVDHDAGRNSIEGQCLESEGNLALKCRRVAGARAFVRDFILR